eukprot:Rhum_TRINITY_DN2329_c0_g1::Rhum_TRINITY_DN2329_c0_g1_i1::g.6911::m.6911
MQRIVRSLSRTAPVRQAMRTQIHQDNKADDMTWLESDREMTAEERYAHQKQQELLKKHADSLNAKYEAEHEATREQMEAHQNKSAASVAALEAKIAELTSMIQQMKAESK